MKIFTLIIGGLVYLPGVALMAQTAPQIGGGICSSATLNGNYSLTLTGRDVGSSLTFSKILQGIGSANFDGQSIVSFTLINNTNAAAGAMEILAGTYSLQANCTGILTINSGDMASFTLNAYNVGKDFLITGQDGTYAFAGSGNTLPVTCNASMLSGTYAFNGSGYALTSSAVSGVNNISGLLQFDGKNAITTTWYVAAATGSTTTATTSGTYTVTPTCTANATVTDSSGHSYSLTFTVTATSGSNFVLSGSSPLLIFAGSGRIL